MCVEEALRRPDRLSVEQRNRLAGTRAELEGDNAGIVAVWDRVLADDSTNIEALGKTSANRMWWMGRFEEALERNRRLMRLVVGGPQDFHWVNLVASLEALGRFDEAREATSHEKGIWKEWQRADIELVACRYPAAESIVVAQADDPRMAVEAPGNAFSFLCQIRFARGALKASAADLERYETLAHTSDYGSRLRYSVFAQGAYPMPPDAWVRDTSITGWLWRGIRATCVGDAPLAQRCLANVRNHPLKFRSQQGAGQALLEARIAIMQRNPREAIRILQPLSALRVDHGKLECGLTWVRWTIADAFERAGQPDSAAVHLERIFSPAWAETALWPSVHNRLALLYARMGRVPDAERHLAALEKAWDRPDPEVLRMLNATRDAVVAARATSHTEGRWK